MCFGACAGGARSTCAVRVAAAAATMSVIARERYEEEREIHAQICGDYGYPSDGKSQVQTLRLRIKLDRSRVRPRSLQSAVCPLTLADEQGA